MRVHLLVNLLCWIYNNDSNIQIQWIKMEKNYYKLSLRKKIVYKWIKWVSIVSSYLQKIKLITVKRRANGENQKVLQSKHCAPVCVCVCKSKTTTNVVKTPASKRKNNDFIHSNQSFGTTIWNIEAI